MEYFLTGFISVALLVFGIIVLKSNSRIITNRYFFGLILFCIVWIISNFLSNILKDYSPVLIANRIIFFSTGYLLFFIHQLSLYYPGGKTKKTSVYLSINWLITIIISLLSLTSFIVKDITIKTNYSEIIFNNGIYFYLSFILYHFVGFIKQIYILIKNSSGLEKLKVQYLFIGLVLSSIGAIVTNLILPIVFNIFSFSNLGPLFLVIFLGSITYSLIKHRLFGVKFIIGQTIAFAINVIIPFTVLFLVDFLNNYRDISNNKIILFLISSVLYASIFPLIDKYMTNLIEKYFLYSGINPIHERDLYIKEISSELNTNKISLLTIALYKKVLEIEKAGIILFDISNRSIIFKKIKGLDSERTKIRDLLEVINYWKNFEHSTIIIKEEIKETELTDNNPRLKRILSFMIENGIEVILPLNRRVQLNGVVLLGKKESGLTYTQEDINYLESIMVNASVALGRSILFTEVENLSRSLQKKVAEQTKDLSNKVKLLEEARRKETDMVDIMGHELRTPISIIKLQFGLLSNRLAKSKLKDKLDKYIINIESAIQREARLINSMLGATKLDKDKMELIIERVRLLDLIKESIDAHLQEAQRKDLKLSIKTKKDSETWEIDVDKIKLLEVLDNLISNALKYSTKGYIEVIMEKSLKYYFISIKDTGEGISRKDLKHIGEKFYRAKPKGESENVVRPGGTGLGLYVSFGIVEKHGGKILVESVLGKGSTFTIKIPIEQERGVNGKKASLNIFERIGLKQNKT